MSEHPQAPAELASIVARDGRGSGLGRRVIRFGAAHLNIAVLDLLLGIRLGGNRLADSTLGLGNIRPRPRQVPLPLGQASAALLNGPLALHDALLPVGPRFSIRTDYVAPLRQALAGVQCT